MSVQIEFWLLILATFAASAAMGFWLVKRMRKEQIPVPRTNAILRVSSLGSIYRSQFIGELPEGWAFTLPIQRDNYSPIEIGEAITIETIVDKGVAVYRTTLKRRSTTPAMFVVAKPTFWHVEDRRDSIRIGELGHMNAKLDGDTVGLLDMSACGALVRSQARHESGKRVRLEVAGFAEAIQAWVLDEVRKGDRYILRLRFEEEMDLSPMMGA